MDDTPFPGLFCPLLAATAAQWVLSGYSLVRWSSGRCGGLSRTPEDLLSPVMGVPLCAAHSPTQGLTPGTGSHDVWRCDRTEVLA